MDRIAYAKIRNGYYVTADGDHQTGTVQGDYSTGFWAYTVTGRRLYRTFDTVQDAAEVLALEHTMAATV